ncbi:hypothetical protein BDV39DRAFT_205400 [Aspergillus sergii]|uniref:Beta-ketoacyl synthase n=1 Tax=Aspergillus sergii TaxID=1034303 RepID=A0A5N6X1B0_9EURO|nr:hypothetical protein BDV39DRAFT_205400 [Aspergillus sergii]
MDSECATTPSSFVMLDSKELQLYHFPNEYPTADLRGLVAHLRQCSKTASHVFLRLFLDDATITLREEFRLLPDDLKATLPPFGNILDLAELPNLSKLPFGSAIESIMLLVVQLGLFIGYYDKHPSEYGLSKTRSCLTGIGAGLLVGAAVASSSTLSELPAAGAEVIRMAVRLEAVAREVGNNLEAVEQGEAPESWAKLVKGLSVETVQKELDVFNSATNLPVQSKIFISGEGIDNVIVSGPPSQLQRLFRFSEKLRYSRFVSIAVYGGPCHAPHIYNSTHVERIVEAVRPSIANRDIKKVPFISVGNGRPYEAATAVELFHCVITEILTCAVRWSKVVRSVIDRLHLTSSETLQLYTFHSYHATQELVATKESGYPACELKSFDLQSWVEDDINEQPINTSDCKIAIVGMACRFPGGADSPNLFWELLEEGRDVHQKVPANRYDVETHTDPTGERRNTSLTPFGCFIDDPGLFDASFFNMSPREAAVCDPMYRLALVTAYEALEHSGYSPNRTPSTNPKRVGTFYGQSCDDYREANANQDVDTYLIPGNCRAFAPGRINYFFKFSGPSFNCDTACSSSLATVQIACTSLHNGDSDMIVAGGLNVLTNADGFAALSRGHFLSKTGGCKTWDVDADGYCRADGIGSIVMKRLPDALADNDNILGVISASATNHSAEAISITHPHAPSQIDLYRQVLNKAGVDPMDVDFVELHGTGTQAGDTTEIESVTKVFAPTAPRRKRPLYIGAVKANVGHGEAAAGITALIKTLLVFKHSKIPRHVGVKRTLNPSFPDLEKLNVKIPWQAVPWERSPHRKRYAMVNNFSAAGGNTTLLLEEPPCQQPPSEADPRAGTVVTVSARGKTSFVNNIERLITHLERNPGLPVGDLSYTTTARRLHHTHRVGVSGQTIEDIAKGLRAYLPSAETQRPVPNEAPSVAFIFSGQGTLHSGVGRQLYELHPVFRKDINQLDDLCQSHGFPSFIPVLTDTENKTFAPLVNHLTLVSVGISLVRLLQTVGIRPSITMGASLGDYAALYAAGVLSASDSLLLAGRRAELLQSKCEMDTHAMLAIRATEEEVKENLHGARYEVAARNGRREMCLSGTIEEITHIRSNLEAAGIKCHQLNVPYAFHSTQMDPILDGFEALAQAATFKAPNVPFISCLLEDCVFDDRTINANYMRRATRETANFIPAVDKAWEMGVVDSKTIWLEIGPQPTFVQFIKNAIPGVSLILPSLRRGEDNFLTLSSTLASVYSAGIDVNWVEWHRPFERNLRLLDDLPSYSWNAKNHWLQYTGDWLLVKNQLPTCIQHADSVGIPSTLRTSLIHQVFEESISGEEGSIIIQSDLMQPEFFEAANGHRMNGHGVVTSSIHVDIALTLAKHLFDRIRPGSQCPGMDMRNLQVLQGLVLRENKTIPQQIRVVATADFSKKLSVQLQWYNVLPDSGHLDDGFASAEVDFGDNQVWLDQWASYAHLVTSRIEVLDRLANEGVANRLSRDLAYTLFANLVDYADRYRGMQQVVLHGMEAAAKVVLSSKDGGNWTIPPEHTDSVSHLAGFILNGGNAVDTRKNFFVTPGFKSFRIAKPLLPGSEYQSYVRMVSQAEPGMYAGDLYILQGGEIIGLVEGLRFRTVPRMLLNKFFSPSDAHQPGLTPCKAAVQKSSIVKELVTASSKAPGQLSVNDQHDTKPLAPAVVEKPSKPSLFVPTAETTPAASANSDPMDKVMGLIAAETSLDLAELEDATEFAAIGVDSLLSLVLAEKFKEKMGIEVRSSIFLDCTTIGALKEWLRESFL